jgi:hypothetical protein
MVALNGDQSHNSSSRYLTIERSEASDARTLNAGLIPNMNPDFNVTWVQTIMETIQRMAPNGSPLVVLAQQGAEAVNVVIIERSIGVPQREPFVGDNDRAMHARSEAASSASPNRHLAEHDARWWITQYRAAQKYGHDQNDLRNVIEDRRRLRLKTPSPPRRSLAEDIAPVGRSGFRALAGPLRQVQCSDKFKVGNIDRYDGSNNPKEFIQVYQTVIEAIRGDDRVKTNFLPTTLTRVARSWVINLPVGSITSWNQLCAMFIGNFQGTYEHPSIAETLKTIRQHHDESLRDYVKYFCNVKNAIPYIEDIKIINAFRDRVSDIKTVEEIVMKRPKTVTDVCIEASEARARLLESRGKGTSRKKDNREVNTADREDHKDRKDHRYHGKQSSEQKEKRLFRCPDDAEKLCEIHRTA